MSRAVTNQAVTKACVEFFKKLSLEYKLSNINQEKAFAEYMNEIGCFYTDKDVDYEFLEGFTEEEQDKDIEPMECMLAMLKVFDGVRIYRL